ncbi:arsenate reductase ArsC [Pelagibius marinus]|uniref:arsenate reductase ArsC n=1 Tax=Pelagibius marinus TaxID=2762760 RepID=UPI00187233BA|nr:arsenate reductase ArsC [Pelagibius marinus]
MISTSETGKVYNILFLCTGNSARSVLAEAIVDRLGQGRFKGYSAGSHPTGRVNPYALDLLKSLDHPTGELRSKSWDVFAAPGAPQMDFVITVCDNAAGEVCPVWPGQPVTAHWPFRDPAAAGGTEAEKRQVFADVYGQIHRRVDIFVNLPIDALDRLSLQKRLREMGTSPAETA